MVYSPPKYKNASAGSSPPMPSSSASTFSTSSDESVEVLPNGHWWLRLERHGELPDEECRAARIIRLRLPKNPELSLAQDGNVVPNSRFILHVSNNDND